VSSSHQKSALLPVISTSPEDFFEDFRPLEADLFGVEDLFGDFFTADDFEVFLLGVLLLDFAAGLFDWEGVFERARDFRPGVRVLFNGC